MVTKEQIVHLLQVNDKAVIRALIVLTERQTEDERLSEQTKFNNGRGFRPCAHGNLDGEVLRQEPVSHSQAACLLARS